MSQSLAKQCNDLKEGIGTADNNECSTLFKEYSSCLQGALKERGIDRLLEDAREDNKENDAAFLGRKK
ncbi:hypothetical protein B0T24DRAFT_227943 [Lasiosphaeria ovina]|uniref:Uncharacterized protein n=1 Tax=Lasiosphaeria ovina TaxID=92902 RepID=A0AAE0KIS2_9PEZI|nr:hypothetical protein B0T24DRAFT_227943 [Lasiosphaeria ovina]